MEDIKKLPEYLTKLVEYEGVAYIGNVKKAGEKQGLITFNTPFNGVVGVATRNDEAIELAAKVCEKQTLEGKLIPVSISLSIGQTEKGTERTVLSYFGSYISKSAFEGM